MGCRPGLATRRVNASSSVFSSGGVSAVGLGQEWLYVEEPDEYRGDEYDNRDDDADHGEDVGGVVAFLARFGDKRAGDRHDWTDGAENGLRCLLACQIASITSVAGN